MFGISRLAGWLRSSRKATNTNPIESVEMALRIMGYDLLPYGAGVALLELQSGYMPAEVASHLAHTTMARDVKERDGDVAAMLAVLPHAQQLLRILKEYKDSGAIRADQWKNDSAAVWGVVAIGPQQRSWIEQILSDPVAAKEPVARSRIDYATSLR